MKKRYEEENASRPSNDVVDEIVAASEQRVGFGADSNDPSDLEVDDDWKTSDEFERDLDGRGRFDR